jgi:GTP-binding protein
MPVHIKSVEFSGAIGQLGQAAPESVRHLPQVAFAGRSNVGKSSLINRMLGRTRTAIARVSATPGKTQEINFYRVRTDVGEFALVDLPGYGFARAPAPLRERWRMLIAGFLGASGQLRGVVQLIDIRHGPTDDDRRAIGYLAEIGLPVLFVLTKADKLRQQKRIAAVAGISATLGVEDSQVIVFSALSGDGVEELREAVAGLVGDAAEPVTAPDRTP